MLEALRRCCCKLPQVTQNTLKLSTESVLSSPRSWPLPLSRNNGPQPEALWVCAVSLLMPKAIVPEQQEQLVRCLAELRQRSAEHMAMLAWEPPLSATVLHSSSPRRRSSQAATCATVQVSGT